MTLIDTRLEVEAAACHPAQLTVLYDEACPLCVRCRLWLETQETWVPLTFHGARSAAAAGWDAELPWLGYELVVVSDKGDAWIGPAAFLVCLWATRRYRHWSFTLSGRALAPMAESFFHLISSRRSRIGRFLPDPCPDGECRHRR